MKFRPIASSSKGNFYILDDNNSKLLIDVGILWNKILNAINYDISNIAGILLDHSDGDHSKSAKKAMDYGINIYSSKETFQELGLLKHHRAKIIEPLKQFEIDNYIILPFPVHHDVVNLGFLIYNKLTKTKLAFATDTYYISHRFNDVNIYAIECNYSKKILDENLSQGKIQKFRYNRLLKSHFSLEHVKEFLRANDLTKTKKIYLLHLSTQNSNAKLFKNEIEGLTGIPTEV